jgi:hypothetical protein
METEGSIAKKTPPSPGRLQERRGIAAGLVILTLPAQSATGVGMETDAHPIS